MTNDYLERARRLGLERSAPWKRFCKNFESIQGNEPTLSGMKFRLRKSKSSPKSQEGEGKTEPKNPFLKAKGQALLPELISENARLSARLLCMEGIVPPASEDNACNIIAAQAGDNRRIEEISEFIALLGYLGDYKAVADAESKSAELREIFTQVARLPKITHKTDFVKDACLAAPLVLCDLAQLGNGSQGWIVASTIVAKGIMRAAGARTLDADPFEGRCAKKFAAFEAALGTAAVSEDGIKDLAEHLFTAINAGFSDACAAAEGKKTAAENENTSFGSYGAKLAQSKKIIKWTGIAAFGWTAVLLLIGLFGEHGVWGHSAATGSADLERSVNQMMFDHTASFAIGVMRLLFGKTSLMMPILSVMLAIWALRLPDAIKKHGASEKATSAELKGVTMLMSLLGTIAGCCYHSSGGIAAGICFFCYALHTGHFPLDLKSLSISKTAPPEIKMCLMYPITIIIAAIVKNFLIASNPLFGG